VKSDYFKVLKRFEMILSAFDSKKRSLATNLIREKTSMRSYWRAMAPITLTAFFSFLMNSAHILKMLRRLLT
jgi:hypothetical protein